MKGRGVMSNGGSRANMGMTTIGGEWKEGVVKVIWVAISGCYDGQQE